ncbi:hypothetical protein AbraIFM66950_007465 [Aspergillus brasiliensis]|nr:hypothetical protein AbraIFM66950_007465 [Aspergillus brasiliensis]
MQIVVICASAKYIAATVPFFVGILFIVQRFYMKTSRQIRLLDIAAKAPLLSHFIETMEGLSTVRAYGWQCFFEERTQELLGSSQKPFYGLYCVQRWLNLVLDLSIASLTILLSGIAVAVRGSLNSGLVALALVNIISLNGNVRLLVIQWSQLETSIAAVARIREYELETPSEVRPEQQEAVLPDGWPRLGRVELRQASASYSAGKSSLLSAVLRMLNLHHGCILIDDVDIAKVHPAQVRTRINTIPQAPYFLPGSSIRASVDPFGNLSDPDIASILQQVRLWEPLGSTIECLGLIVSDSLLSHGQRQLLSLARALGRRASSGNILLLDEPTSQLDLTTEEIVQQVIYSSFCDHTIISIAHRLTTVLDYDMVVVLDQGVAVEMGPPRELLSRPQSAFRELYRRQQGDN